MKEQAHNNNNIKNFDKLINKEEEIKNLPSVTQFTHFKHPF